jgi:uncharacterized YccA/Bax inhibitor family protein
MDPSAQAVLVRHRVRAGHGADVADATPLSWLVADLMTMKAVVARATTVFGLTVVTAVLSWALSPVPPANPGRACVLAGGAAVVVAVLVLIQCRLSRPFAVLTLGYGMAQGVFLGVLSETASTYVSGVFVQLVLGTMAAFAGVLVAYPARWIRMPDRGHGFVCAAVLGVIMLIVADVLLSPFLGAEGLGFRSVFGGVTFGVMGIVVATPFIAVCFKQVEYGITHGAPRQESWAAAFGVTLTLVWLYVETLRLITLVPAEDV